MYYELCRPTCTVYLLLNCKSHKLQIIEFIRCIVTNDCLCTLMAKNVVLQAMHYWATSFIDLDSRRPRCHWTFCPLDSKFSEHSEGLHSLRPKADVQSGHSSKFS